MIEEKNIEINKISWLSTSWGGVNNAYFPESVEELKSLCNSLYSKNNKFYVVGHTSNIYFAPDCTIDKIVSTKYLRKYVIKDSTIECEAGVPVASLARKMVDIGIKGFEGLVDLPGTIGGAIYGNAECYGCSVNSILVSFDLLLSDGTIKRYTPKDLNLSLRNSSLKAHHLKGVILSAVLKRELGDADVIKEKSEIIHNDRKIKQPSAKDNLGSIFVTSTKPTFLNRFLQILSKSLEYTLWSHIKDKKQMSDRKKVFYLRILGASDLIPYVYDWNRYIWKDKRSHVLFERYVKLHRKLFYDNDFEIEILKE